MTQPSLKGISGCIRYFAGSVLRENIFGTSSCFLLQSVRVIQRVTACNCLTGLASTDETRLSQVKRFAILKSKFVLAHLFEDHLSVNFNSRTAALKS
jgi:hypothetical protein